MRLPTASAVRGWRLLPTASAVRGWRLPAAAALPGPHGRQRRPRRPCSHRPVHTAGSVVEEAKLPIEIEEYVERFKPALVDVVYAWCGGAKFAALCAMTDAYEGSIIRAMHRLEELLRQLVDAAKVVGNGELEETCEAARKLIIRDVVFAQSLYT